MGLAQAVSACANLQYCARPDAGQSSWRGAIRVAIYASVSTGEQNPELQIRELRDYAERRGFIVHREYVEKVTGDVRRRKRAPEFEAMMAAARRRRFPSRCRSGPHHRLRPPILCEVLDRILAVVHIVLFKIDAYDLDHSGHSPDPADPSVICRVMTLMLADEY